MKVYPLDETIERILEDFTDPETGELKKFMPGPDGSPAEVPYAVCMEYEASGVQIDYLDSEQLLMERLEAARLDHTELIHQIYYDYINRGAEAEAIKTEKLKLSKRRKTAENARDRAERFLAYLTNGEKFKDEVAVISYRKSYSVEVDDDFCEWASVYAPGLIKAEPVPRKPEILQLIKKGQSFEHARLVTKQNIQIK